MSKNGEIPRGLYCYDENGICPHWELRLDKENQNNGYCHLLEKGDWEFEDFSGLLWDQCKECNINYPSEEEIFDESTRT